MKEFDEQAAFSGFLKLLQRIPFLRLIVAETGGLRDAESDYQVDILINDRPTKLLIEIKSNGQPRFARQAAYELKHRSIGLSNTYGIFIAPYISQEAAPVLLEAGIGYFDLAGNCHLSFDTVYIHQENFANPLVQKRNLRSLYSPKAERILRVLLTDTQRIWKTEALAGAAEVSLGQVSNVKKLLADREWLVNNSKGIRLSKPGALLDEWSVQYKSGRNKVEEYYAIAEVSEIEYQLAEICEQKSRTCMLTGFSGAARLAPTVRYQRGTAYIDSQIDSAFIESLGWKLVDSGGNFSLLFPYDRGVFYGAREIDGVQVASLVQIYLDLQGARGRGREAAQAIRREMEKEW